MDRNRWKPVVQVAFPGSRYTITKLRNRFWAVKLGEELIAMVVYKKGAREVVRHLEERDALKRKFSGLRLISDVVESTSVSTERRSTS